MNISTLGLMRRASALEIGQDRAVACIKNGHAKLVVLPSDVNDRVKRNAEFAVNGKKNPKIIIVPWTNEDISKAIGVGSCSMLAITDRGFADSLMKEYGGR